MELESKAGHILGYSFLVVFANDGIIDAEELMMMKELALADRIVDEDEKHVLRHIFSRPDPAEMSLEVRAEIREFRQKYDI
jgi:hypothetical protein